ncbi:hypothetical protein TI05_08065 [Achromatium sp. WMS3]|nr:hypothetical protein TI05_08065 [Achromatium sp. WMS3]
MNGDSWDPIWENVFSSQQWGKYPAESLISFIARNFYSKTRNKIKILEIGCGPGANVWYLCREGYDVYAIEGSKTAIKQALQRLKEENLKANIRIGDFITLPYDDNSFDAVIDVEALYSNSKSHTKKILSEVSRVLKTDGLFYSRTFSDEMYIGDNYTQCDSLEYKDIKNGPLEGKGFVRLSNYESINNIYNIEELKVLSVDKLTATYKNQLITVDEYIVIAQKKIST